MTIPLQITFCGFPHSGAIETEIRAKITTFEKHHVDIMDCHVHVEAQHFVFQQGKLSQVQIELSVPEKILVISFSHQVMDMYGVIENTFDAANEQLADYARQRFK